MVGGQRESVRLPYLPRRIVCGVVARKVAGDRRIRRQGRGRRADPGSEGHRLVVPQVRSFPPGTSGQRYPVGKDGICGHVDFGAWAVGI